MTQITQDTIDCWRINYALDKRSPEDAMRWWAIHNGGAPAGAVAALGLVLLEREALIAERDRLRDWLECEVNCPCCEGVQSCPDGCTFATDCPHEAEHMQNVREVLWPGVGGEP